MKLLLCGYCKDIVALHVDETRACRCGRTKAKYRDDHWHADIYPLLAARDAAADGRMLPCAATCGTTWRHLVAECQVRDPHLLLHRRDRVRAGIERDRNGRVSQAF